jgi:hypothetical protein
MKKNAAKDHPNPVLIGLVLGAHVMGALAAIKAQLSEEARRAPGSIRLPSTSDSVPSRILHKSICHIFDIGLWPRRRIAYPPEGAWDDASRP